MPAVHAVLVLPEALLHLDADLADQGVGHPADRLLELRRHLQVHGPQDRQRDAAHHVVGRLGPRLAGLGVEVVDGDRLVVLGDRLDLVLQLDLHLQVPHEALGQFVHAADRLEHGALLVEVGDRAQHLPRARLQDVGHGIGLGPRPRAGIHARTGVDGRLAAFRADVLEVLAGQHALGAQVVEEQLLVAGAEFGVQRALAHLLGQQLVGVAAHVGGHLHLLDRLAGQRARAALIEDARLVVVVVEQLHAHAELLGVVQVALVEVGDPPGAGVDVIAFVEVAGLRLAAHFGQLGPLAGRPRAAAEAVARFQHRHLVAGVRQLVGRGQAGHARAQHDHLLALAAAGQGGRLGHGRFDAEAERAHAGQDEGRAPHAPQPLQERPAAEAISVGSGRLGHRCGFSLQGTPDSDHPCGRRRPSGEIKLPAPNPRRNLQRRSSAYACLKRSNRRRCGVNFDVYMTSRYIVILRCIKYPILTIWSKTEFKRANSWLRRRKRFRPGR